MVSVSSTILSYIGIRIAQYVVSVVDVFRLLGTAL